MLADLWRRVTGQPEPRAIGQLRTIANERNGHFDLISLSEHDTLTLARIEWITPDGRIVGGEARGQTAQQAASELLLNLRTAGVV